MKIGKTIQSVEKAVSKLDKVDVKKAGETIAKDAQVGWHSGGSTAQKLGKTAADVGAQTVGVAELGGLRYSVKSYESKLSDGLTRGARLDTPEQFADLKNRGFKGIVDLTLEGTKDETLAKPAGLNALNVRILDNSAPTNAQMKQFLDFATDPANSPCYVHCEAGQGRTGVASACYRMAVEGWTAEQALAEAKTFGLKLHNQTQFIEQFGAALKAGEFAGYPKTTVAPTNPIFATPPVNGPSKFDLLAQKAEGQVAAGKLLSAGAGTKIGEQLRDLVDFKDDQEAFKRVSGMTDAQLAAMRAPQVAELAERLLDANLPDKLFGANAEDRSAQALRLLTSHGTDAAHLDSILGRLPYGRDVADALRGPAKEAFAKLQAAGRATPGDWNGLEKYLDVATGTQLRPGTKVTPLIDGKTAFPAMYEAIDQAKSSVNMTVYAFQSDPTGWEMAKHMAAAADRGAAVKLIYDPIGSKTTGGAPTDPAIYAFLKKHGVQVVAQQPGPLGDHLTHRKITVVDGTTGFIGGMNVGDQYAKTWHDTHTMMTGPGVADLSTLFAEQWKANGQTLSTADKASMFPTLAAVSEGSARVIGHLGRDDQNMKLAYLRAIDTAQKNINIASPYFNDADVVTHLKQAAARGVAVTVVMPHENDAALNQQASRATYADMISSGIGVYEYFGHPMAHEKVATFDGKLVTVGSSNLDARSLSNNDEANVWTQDAAAAATLDERLFKTDLSQATRITADQAQAFAAAFKNKLAEKLAPQL